MDIFIDSYENLSKKVYEIFKGDFEKACNEEKKFSCIISGGRGPKGFFELTNRYFRFFEYVDFFISDERISSDEKELNYLMIESALFKNIKGFKFHKIDPVSNSLNKYLYEIKNFIDRNLFFDIAILGIGADGHIASLFDKRYCCDDLVIETTAPSFYRTKKRVTLNYTAINMAKKCLFIVSGSEKEELKLNILKGEISKYPFSNITVDSFYFIEK